MPVVRRMSWALGAVVVIAMTAGFVAQQASKETEAVLKVAPKSIALAQAEMELPASSTSISMPEATPTETAIPMRFDCEAVDATGFVSWDEREWYFETCTEPEPPPEPVSAVAAAVYVPPRVVVEPTPTPEPPPPVVVPLGEIEEMVCSYGWDCSWALSVMYCESGGNPNAYNPAGPYIGLFQIHESLGTNLYDPATNIARAYSLYLSHGPSAWGGCA